MRPENATDGHLHRPAPEDHELPFPKWVIIENWSNGSQVTASESWATKNIQNKFQRCIWLTLYVFLGSISSMY